jgi:membrane-bound lytic murein transglycosylase D
MWWMMDALRPILRIRSNARWLGWLVSALLLAIGGGIISQARAEVIAPSRDFMGFPRPALIEPNIAFWVNVFANYSVRDFLVHDKDNVWKVYEVLHIPGEGSPSPQDVEWANTYLKTKYADILSRLAEGRQPATYDEQRVAFLFRNEQTPNFAAAAQNLRVQQGMEENFRDTLVRARVYLPDIERVFSSMGLPAGLAILPTVESGFRLYARSKCGAMGLWQFTRSTGKEYMTVSGWHDDRLDPVKATQAAAELLSHNHELLGNWPLAITAYNYGAGGMLQAVEATNGGDYCEILRRWDGPRFGFASKNYYPEFLAALQVYQYRDQYFPGIEEEQPEFFEPPPAPHVEHVRYTSRRHVSLRRVAYGGHAARHRYHAIYHGGHAHRRLRSA